MTQSQVVAVEAIREIPGADRIEMIKVLGWFVIVQKGLYAVGDKCVFIFPDTTVSGHFAETLGLKKTRIRAMKMRGVISEGLVMPYPKRDDFAEEATDAWFGLNKWEPPASSLPGWMGRGRVRPSNPDFPRHRDTDNIRKSLRLWQGQQVVATVKIHGTNVRFGWINGEWMVGSRNVDLECNADESGRSVYERAVEPFRDLCPKEGNILFIGEIFGRGIQDLDYGVPEGVPLVQVFAVMKNTFYLPILEALNVAFNHQIPRVPIVYRGPFDFDALEALAVVNEDPKYFPGAKHIREGIVVSEIDNMLPPMKLVSPRYLTRDNGTEWH